MRSGEANLVRLGRGLLPPNDVSSLTESVNLRFLLRVGVREPMDDVSLATEVRSSSLS